MQAHEDTAISTRAPKVLKKFVDDIYSILKRARFKSFFHQISKLHQDIKFTMEEEINGELEI